MLIKVKLHLKLRALTDLTILASITKQFDEFLKEKEKSEQFRPYCLFS